MDDFGSTAQDVSTKSVFCHTRVQIIGQIIFLWVENQWKYLCIWFEINWYYKHIRVCILLWFFYLQKSIPLPYLFNILQKQYNYKTAVCETIVSDIEIWSRYMYNIFLPSQNFSKYKRNDGFVENNHFIKCFQIALVHIFDAE